MEWIKCSERMPDVGQKVLFATELSDRPNIESGEYLGNGEFMTCWFDTRNKRGVDYYRVNNWMPAPPLP